MKDKDSMGKNEEIGSLELHYYDFSAGTVDDKWWTLKPAKEVKGKTPRIHMISHICPDKAQPFVPCPFQFIDLACRICEADNLPMMDFLNPPDAYVIINYATETQDYVKTKVVSSKKPKWDEEYVFNLLTKETVLYFKLMDQDMISADHIGIVELHLDQVPIGQIIESWFDIKKEGSNSKRGRLRMIIQIIPHGHEPFTPYTPPIKPLRGTPLPPGVDTNVAPPHQ